jgi:hypothetical protein
MVTSMKPSTPFILLYGPSGLGKTTDLLYAFPHGRFIAPPRALEPARTVCGITLRDDQAPKDIRTLQDVIKAVKAKDSRPVIVDDTTILAEQTLAAMPPVYSSQGKLDQYAPWNLLATLFLELREAALYKDVPVVLSFHRAEATINKAGVRVLGGPAIKGQSKVTLPTACNLVLHGVLKSRLHGAWPAVCRVKPADLDYLPSKDRYNVIRDGCPMNLGEILRIAGLEMPRTKEVDEFEPLIDEVATALVELGSDKEAVKPAGALLDDLRESLADESKFVRNWVVRDTQDRAEILLKLL